MGSTDKAAVSVDGIRAFYLAILRQAFKDMRKTRYRKGVLRWVRIGNIGTVTFLDCCTVLDVPPGIVRKLIESEGR